MLMCMFCSRGSACGMHVISIRACVTSHISSATAAGVAVETSCSLACERRSLSCHTADAELAKPSDFAYEECVSMNIELHLPVS